MSITDELRGFARRWPCTDYIHKDMLAIADRIDAEHERQLGVLYRDMSDAEWVRLPVDADGVPIHVGDVMEFSAFEIEKPVTRMVDGIGQGVFFAWCGERGYQQHEAKRYRHYHAPTVEDVMVEFATDWESAQDGEDKAAVLKEYAAKLRLAEEGA